ncbi:SpoIIE family protein phosphatase [Chitinispirillales bacterium ANBcel5]|uniref:SpoIIE family protein phosphatase n=1 Tax=Cellulosispirillum alkaliphilum TaxID=3039283 RepID=UPI002A580B08|nr:SpoIIE family protein phosphatase [Chitinispirillales bacterium ANBcel5]
MIQNQEVFIEIGSLHYSKHKKKASGDVQLTRKLEQGRVVSILCDGLGSGVEANVLASFTASMGLEYMASDLKIKRAAEIIMDALPLCPSRKISYSTFSIADVSLAGEMRIIGHGNPPFLFFRGAQAIEREQTELLRPRWKNRSLHYARFGVEVGDRLIMMSDGVTQSGMGSDSWPMGFGIERVNIIVEEAVRKNREISADELAEIICNVALANDGNRAGDDISCTVIYMRNPRRMRVLTGPPFDPKRDQEYASLIKNFSGKCVLCGGTTSTIVERELGLEAVMDFSYMDPVVPAVSHMKGVDLITEGCITLSNLAGLLEKGERGGRKNGATMLRDLMLSCDIIDFYVGTRVNQSHQDPALPIELDIRRNVIKKIASLLETKYLKETTVRYY